MEGTVVKISESKKSVLLAVRTNAMCYGNQLVYVPNAGYTMKQIVPIEGDPKIVPWKSRNQETGLIELRQTKDGVALMVFA